MCTASAAITVALVRTSVLRRVRGDALAAGDLHIGLDEVAVARIVVRIDQGEVAPGPDRQAEAGEPLFEHRRPADQDRTRESLLDHDLGRPQDALILAFGVDDAHRLALRLGEHRLHDEAGAEDKTVEPFLVGVEVGDRPRRDAGRHRRLGDRRRDAQDQARIERIGDERARAEGQRLAAHRPCCDLRRRLARQHRDRLDRRHLHLFVDGGGADVEGAAEDVRKTEDVVHLVGVVGAAGTDQRVGPRGERDVRHDLRRRVGQRQDQRPVRHALDHVGLKDAGGRNAEENVGTLDHLAERALVGLLCIDAFPAVHQRRPALVDDALDIGDPDVLAPGAERDQEVQAGDRRGAGARRHDLDLLDALAGEMKPVVDGGTDDDRGAVLIVMEHRDLHALLELRFDVEAFRRLDVLQVDAAESRLKRGDDVDDAIDLVRIDLDVEHIDAGELLEQHRLAFHHRLARQRADIAEAEHRGAVRHHRHQVCPAGQGGRLGRIGGDLLAGGRDSGRVGERQVMLGAERLGRMNLDLSGTGQAVIGERARAQIVRQIG